jgi:hypothetical protein
MKYFSHKCIIKCVRNKTQESIILIHLNTFVATLKSTWRKLRSSFTCGDPFGSHLPTKENFWSPKVSASIHHQVHANVSERHVPLRLLHPCSSESGTQHQHLQLLQRKCLKKAHPLKTPSPMFFGIRMQTPHLTIAAKGTSPQDSFTYVLRNRNANTHICLKLQPVIDDNLDL